MKCRQALDEDLDSICDMLAAEFSSDSLYQFLFPDHDSRNDILREFFRIYVNLAYEHGGILITGNYAGVLVYYRPEAMKLLDGENSFVDNQLRKVCGSNYKIAAKLINGLDNCHPRSPPHYFILLLAVERAHRGGRVVGDIFKEFNAMLDKNNLPCYAECTKRTTKTLLRRWGYFDTGFPLKVEGCPELFPVWRDPHGGVCL